MTMNNKLNLELAKQSYKLGSKSSLGCYAMLTAITYFFWGKLPSYILFSWVGINFFGATVFLFASYQFERHATEKNASKWLNACTYLVLLSEGPWGFIGPISYMIDNEIYHLLTLFILGGVTASKIITRSILFKNYVVTLISLLSPTVVTLALQKTALAESMLILTMIYIVFMLWVAKSYSASINRNIHLWLNNENLVEELQTSHAEIKATNQELTKEIEYRKKIESELIVAKERSERASESKNQFLANVSHELRTPLNGIMGFAELLQDENLDQKYIHFINQIDKAARNLLHIVNDILDITSIEAGQISLNEAPFSLRSEMEDIVDILRPNAERKNLMLTMCIDDDVEDRLYGDANRLRQIISNLLSNAVKYTELGFVSLSISQVNRVDKQVVLRFEIVDTGIGIAEDELNTIFDNFTRAENFETRQTEGTGLGLAIVKSLSKKMQGKLSVHSIPNEGSCFSFEIALPISQELQSNTEVTKAPRVTSQQWEAFNVLVVDDNEINCILLCAFLAKLGITYEVATNGYEALQQIRQGSYDVVLMDIQMPGMSGLDVANRLRTEGTEIPILIAVTAHAFQEQHQTILEAGFSDLVTKPIGMDGLVKTLTHAYCGEYSKDSDSVDYHFNRQIKLGGSQQISP